MIFIASTVSVCAASRFSDLDDRRCFIRHRGAVREISDSRSDCSDNDNPCFGEPIGSITELEGAAKVTRVDGTQVSLTTSREIYQGGVLKTAAKAGISTFTFQ